MIHSGKCSDISDHSSLNHALELNGWLSSICCTWWFWIYVWKAKPFPSTQVYHGVGMIANQGEEAYKQRGKRCKMLLFLLQVKKASLGRNYEYTGNSHVSSHLGNSVYCTLANAGINLHQIQETVDEHPFGLLWLAVFVQRIFFCRQLLRNIFEVEHYWERVA